MAETRLDEVVNQIETQWSAMYDDELRASHAIAQLLDKSHEAEFGNGNDTARISMEEKQTGQLLTIDPVDATDTSDSFTPVAQTFSHVDLKINKRAVSSREYRDTVQFLSKVDPNSDSLRQTMAYEVAEQINNHLYSLVSASVAAPDHTLVVPTMAASDLTLLDRMANEANWVRGNRWLLVKPGYYQDLLDAQTLVSADSVGSSDRPQIGGEFVQQRFGWNIVMDNSDGISQLGTLTTHKAAIAFCPDFMTWASPFSNYQVSSTHSNAKFGTIMSADTIFGAVQSVEGAKKVITIKEVI